MFLFLQSTHMVDPMEEDEWLEEEFCVKMLCEHDQVGFEEAQSTQRVCLSYSS